MAENVVEKKTPPEPEKEESTYLDFDQVAIDQASVDLDILDNDEKLISDEMHAPEATGDTTSTKGISLNDKKREAMLFIAKKRGGTTRLFFIGASCMVETESP